MFKWLTRLLLIVVIALVAILVVRDDPGFVLLKYRDYSIETSLAFGIVAVIALMIVVLIFLKVVRIIWRLPVSMKNQSQTRRFDKSRRLLNQGLIDLAEGRFSQAENNLIKLVDYSESPLLHYLAAARAAQLQEKYEARDSYLRAAHEAKPEAEIAIGVTQAELQLAHKQSEQALATLQHLRGIAPRHDYVLGLLARTYSELEDWPALVELLPNVRKKKLLPEERIVTIEKKAYRGLLDLADGQTLEKTWHKIPNEWRSDPAILVHYLRRCSKLGLGSAANAQLIVKSLGQRWDDELIDIYGLLDSGDADSQLKQAERWLADYSQDEHLLLALGRICMRVRLWGKAQGYFEASIGARVTPASCLALAELYQHQLDQPDKATEYYQMGLKHSLSDIAQTSALTTA
jgi:HemY protein